MSEFDEKIIIEGLIDLCKVKGIKSFRYNNLSFEFFPLESKAPEPMAMDPLALSKILVDSMPPDSAMLYAAVDDPAPEPILNPSEGNPDQMA